MLSLIFDKINDCKLVKGYAMIMWDSCISLIGQPHLPVLHGVDLALLQLSMPLGCGLVVHGCLDLGVLFVHEVKIKKASLTLGILPISDVVLFCDLYLDHPILSKSVEAAHRHEHLVLWKIYFRPIVATDFVGLSRRHTSLDSRPVKILWNYLWLFIPVLISLSNGNGEIKICRKTILRSIF